MTMSFTMLSSFHSHNWKENGGLQSTQCAKFVPVLFRPGDDWIVASSIDAAKNAARSDVVKVYDSPNMPLQTKKTICLLEPITEVRLLDNVKSWRKGSYFHLGPFQYFAPRANTTSLVTRITVSIKERNSTTPSNGGRVECPQLTSRLH